MTPLSFGVRCGSGVSGRLLTRDPIQEKPNTRMLLTSPSRVIYPMPTRRPHGQLAKPQAAPRRIAILASGYGIADADNGFNGCRIR